jgi:aminoglycoside phosphotransferase (APT) family kinase protein
MEVCLDRLEALEARCGVKFSVLIHGDFNTDNIILPFEGDGRGVRLIDLHRSRLGDYLQDASVFLVSNFRLQIFEAPVRRRIQDTMRWVLDFTREQAARWDDVHAEPRLGLGLVRSLITSTRFILDEGFARELHLRGEFVMERLLRAQAPSDFQLPEELFRD